MDFYRSADWATFRNEVIRLDGGACTECGKKATDGAVLQVHHKQYLPGRKPWEYPHEMCATVCRGCHAAAHGIIPPRFGWEYVGWNDLGGLDGTCEYCGEPIRYVFMVQHEKWRVMEVGEICCGHLTSEPTATEFMDSRRRYADRQKRFIRSSRWKPRQAGVEHIRHRLINIDVVPIDGRGFKLRINSVLGNKVFPTSDVAKAKAFDLVESHEIDDFLNRQFARRS